MAYSVVIPEEVAAALIERGYPGALARLRRYLQQWADLASITQGSLISAARDQESGLLRFDYQGCSVLFDVFNETRTVRVLKVSFSQTRHALRSVKRASEEEESGA